MKKKIPTEKLVQEALIWTPKEYRTVLRALHPNILIAFVTSVIGVQIMDEQPKKVSPGVTP